MITGKHLIAGEWIENETKFETDPVSGQAIKFGEATSQHIHQACSAAEEAFLSFGWTSTRQRADFLRTIAGEINALGDEITQMGMSETGLPEGRLIGERGRTVNQLRLFADHIEQGDYLDFRHDEALPHREPIARSDLKLIHRPVGPVAVFGASNFPLAFSTAGGDTASALAAGCPVIVKGHPAHAGTGELVAKAVHRALKKSQLHPGVFSLLQGSTHELGTALVTHPLIHAVGFTGSLNGGRALFDLCMHRQTPIPFYGELGSVNPVFLLPDALAERGDEIAKGWAESLTMGAGQFCTNPGIVIGVAGAELKAFKQAAASALSEIPPQAMLTDGIGESFAAGVRKLRARGDLRAFFEQDFDRRTAMPNVFEVSAKIWTQEPDLHHEIFGPAALILEAKDVGELNDVARSLEGQLTATLQMSGGDAETAKNLIPILERKAGRLLVNGFPTGVEVCDAMVHGGPYPASTNFGATSVGTMAIRRFLRPVCYQDFPDELLPSFR